MTTTTTSTSTAKAYSQLTITDLTDNVGGGNLIIHSTATISADQTTTTITKDNDTQTVTGTPSFLEGKTIITSNDGTIVTISADRKTVTITKDNDIQTISGIVSTSGDGTTTITSNDGTIVTISADKNGKNLCEKIFKIDNGGISFFSDSDSVTISGYFEDDTSPSFSTTLSFPETETSSILLGSYTYCFRNEEKTKNFLHLIVGNNRYITYNLTSVIEPDIDYVFSLDYIFSKGTNDDSVFYQIDLNYIKLEQGNLKTSWGLCDQDISFLIKNDSLSYTDKKCENNNTGIKILGAALGFTPIQKEDLEKYKGMLGVIETITEEGEKTYALATNFIQTSMLATDAIKSSEFKNFLDEEGFCETGTFLDLHSGNFYSPNFIITDDKAKFKGELIAPTGTIGGFSLDKNKLSCGSDSNYVAIIGNNSNGYAFWAGGEEDSDAPFSIKYDGTMKANNATVNGNITANAGSIGCLTVESNKLFTDLLEITSDSFKLKDSSTDYLIFSKNNEISSLDLQNISKLQLANGIEISENKLSFTGDSGINISSGNICIGTTTSTDTSDTNYLTVNAGGLQMYNVPAEKTPEEKSTIININSKGFSFTPTGTTAYQPSTNTYFQMGSDLIYDSELGLLFGKNLTKDIIDLIIINKKKEGTTYDGVIRDSDDKNINFLIEEKGLFFFTSSKIQEPIAYFANDNLYVNKTQVLLQQRISGFQWFVREGSNYLGNKQHNLGLKWIG